MTSPATSAGGLTFRAGLHPQGATGFACDHRLSFAARASASSLGRIRSFGVYLPSVSDRRGGKEFGRGHDLLVPLVSAEYFRGDRQMYDPEAARLSTPHVLAHWREFL
jgi:hypothetical protein